MVIQWNEAQSPMLKKMNIPFDPAADLTDKELEELYEIVPDYMLGNTDTEDYRSTSAFMICESIIDALIASMRKRNLLAS